MRIKDLPAPVTTSKEDFSQSTTWMGFTPTSDSSTSRNKCQSTIQRQFGKGYVIEYIIKSKHKPNAGFENHPSYLKYLKNHKKSAGCFVAVHKLRTTSRHLEEIIGSEDYNNLQKVWANEGKQYRWSVAFPVVESYRIVGSPKAKDILGDRLFLSLYGHLSATLRPLDDEHREKIAGLEIEKLSAPNEWIAIEDEVKLAEGSKINSTIKKLIEDDLKDVCATEGMTEEYLGKRRLRATWLAQRFINDRQENNRIFCDVCQINPSEWIKKEGMDPQKAKPRSLMDVHHKYPLREGERYTTIEDFALLCPNCHRMEHLLLKHGRSQFKE